VAVAVPAVDPALALAFAAVLDYPREPLAASALRLAELVRGASDEAAGLLEQLAAYAAESTLGELQEAYTAAFDLDSLSQTEPTCYPYVGHHLFEENHKRSAFILGLRKRYRAHGFDEPGELPDHLVVLLRFLAHCPDEELAGELVDEGLLPGLERMLQAQEPAPSPTGRSLYCGAVRALALVLAASRPARQLDDLTRAEQDAWARPGDSLGIDRDWCH
jgi:nitrate reductase delta subunit